MARVVVGRAWGDTRAQRMTRLLGVAWRGATWRGGIQRGVARHGAMHAAWRRVGRKARLPAHARPCLRLRADISYSRPPLVHRSLCRDPRPSRAHHAFVSLSFSFSLSRFIA